MKPKITKTAIKKSAKIYQALSITRNPGAKPALGLIWKCEERERERERGCTVWYEKAIKALRFECEKKDLERRKRQREKEKGKN